MKTILVFLFVFTISILPVFPMIDSSEAWSSPVPLPDSAQAQPDFYSASPLLVAANSSLRRNYADHPVLQGERATDAGSSAMSHLAPLIFMVMAFVLSFVAGCLGLYLIIDQPLMPNQSQPQSTGSVAGSPSLPLFGSLDKTLVWLLVMSGTFALVSAILLTIPSFAGHQHPPWIITFSHSHYLMEMIFALFAFCVLFFTWVYIRRAKNPPRKFKGVTHLLEVLLILIVLAIIIKLFHVAHHSYDVLHRLLNFSLVVLLGAIAFIVLGYIIQGTPRKPYSIIFIGAGFQLIVIVMLLTPRHVYKLCNGSCVMHGSQAGIAFDQPCADNVAFMTLHHTNDLSVVDFESFYQSSPEPLFFEYSSAIAMHDPIFPSIVTNNGTLESEPITFTLKDEKRLIKECSLYVKATDYTSNDLLRNTEMVPADNVAGNLKASWKFNRDIDKYERTIPHSDLKFDSVFYEGRVPAAAGGVTYVTYKFVVKYLEYSNAAGLSVQTPDEHIEVHFVLQNFLTEFSKHPTPVYVQGHQKDLLDILFIPAIDHAGQPMDAAFISDFRKSCRSIIKDAIFKEPSVKYWRKQFNFWINNEAGIARDASCSDCCHDPPSNFTGPLRYISHDIEFKALLHKGPKWDFTDGCNAFFSAEMDLVGDYGERSSFLHELGHVAYGLSDEYYGGYNVEATEHLPNNWVSRHRAMKAAPDRRKEKDDVTRIF